MCPCVELGCCTHKIERALSRTARAPLCRLTACRGFTSARTRIRWSFTCLVCVSLTATRPCPPRTRHHCMRRPRSSRFRVFVRTDGRTPCICSYLNIILEVFSVARHNAHLSVWNLPEKHEHLSVSGHNDTSSVSNFLASSSEDAASLEPTSPSCREDKFRHPCCDHMDDCAFQGSVVVRREVSVSMCSFCISSHKQLQSSISLEAMSTHWTPHLLREFVASERC